LKLFLTNETLRPRARRAPTSSTAADCTQKTVNRNTSPANVTMANQTPTVLPIAAMIHEISGKLFGSVGRPPEIMPPGRKRVSNGRMTRNVAARPKARRVERRATRKQFTRVYFLRLEAYDKGLFDRAARVLLCSLWKHDDLNAQESR
jgi:hypothetical protein